MTQLETLIQTLCPNGVKFVKLGEVVAYEQPSKYIVKSTEYDDSYDIPVLTAGQSFILGYTNEKDGIYPASPSDPVVIFDDFTTSMQWVDFPFKVKSSAMKILTSRDNETALIRYLYFALKTIKYTPDTATHARQWIGTYAELQIPLPPLAVQSEIVRILDKFTLYKSELAAELAARLQQYEYYRDQLLTFDDTVKRVKLGEVGKICMCKRILKSETNTVKGIPFYKIGTFGRTPDAYITEELFEEYKNKYNYPLKGQILISASGTIGRTVIFDGEPAYFQDSNIIWIDNREELVLNKFLYYYYQLQPWNVSTGGTIARLYSYNIENAVIPIPSLEEQERIVSILDRFDKLCHDIREGLPAEIDLRQKQYEHYRDKLLTFEAKG